MSAGILAAASAFFAVLIVVSGRLFSGSGNCGCFGEGGLQLTIQQMFMIDLTNSFFGAVLARIKEAPLSIDRYLHKKS